MLSLRPVRDFENAQRTIDRFFSDPMFRFFEEPGRHLETRSWTPAVDIYEAGGEIVFNMELPGFEKNELDINVENNRLTVSGERVFKEQEGKDFHRVERWYGKFQRSFQLPSTVDVDNISANLKNGLLTLTIPKREEAKPRQIKVGS